MLMTTPSIRLTTTTATTTPPSSTSALRIIGCIVPPSDVGLERQNSFRPLRRNYDVRLAVEQLDLTTNPKLPSSGGASVWFRAQPTDAPANILDQWAKLRVSVPP